MKAKERHELKHDVYVDTMIRVWTRIASHWRGICGVFVALVVLATVIAWSVVTSRTAEANAWTQLAVVQAHLMNAERGEADAEDALQAAAAECEATIKTYKSTEAAKFAQFHLGIIRHRQRKYKDAISIFQELLREHERPEQLLLWTRRALAASLEEDGRFEEAAQIYGRLAIGAPESRAAAYWDSGRCFERANKLHFAWNAYEQAYRHAPGTDFGKLAQFRLNSMKQRGSSSVAGADSSVALQKEVADSTPSAQAAPESPKVEPNAKTGESGEKSESNEQPEMMKKVGN